MSKATPAMAANALLRCHAKMRLWLQAQLGVASPMHVVPDRMEFRVIMEYLVNISKRRAFWSLNEDILKITILTTNTPYPSRKIRRIRACTHQRPQRKQAQYAVSREAQYAVFKIMDDPNITMEEYIRLEEEKARKHGKVFNWETTKYGKIWYDEDIHDLRSVETEFLAIAFNDESNTAYQLAWIRHMALPPRDQRHQYLRFGEAVIDLDTAGALLFQLGGTVGFGAYWVDSTRQIPNKGNLRDYWIGISSAGDFLGTVPSYTTIQDPILMMCHRLISCSIVGRTRLAEHFGLLTAEILQGLTVIAPKLPIIDMAELVRLQICMEVDDTTQDQRGSRLLRLVPLRPLRMLLLSMRVARLFRHPYRHLSSHHHLQLLLGLCHRGWPGPRKRNIDEYLWRIYKSGNLEVLKSCNFKAVVQHNLA
ncbi:hypothetical protein Tco_0430991 [Tanacetum coccineum]